MARCNRAWARPSGRPFSDAEDSRLLDMIGCGLAFDFYKDHLPGRTCGEILARRLDLINQGRVTRPAML